MKTKNIIILSFLLGILASFFAKNLILQDFTIYWKSTQNFVNQINPYNLPNQTQYIEGNIGGINKTNFTLKMWGPPTVFGAIFPFGYLNQQEAKIIYLFLLFSLLTFITLKFEKKYLIENSIFLRPLEKAVLYSSVAFATMEIIRSGGVSWIALIGIATAILLFEKGLFFFGALSLYPILIKTQTLLLFIYLLLLVAVRDKRFGIVLGLISIVVINTIVVVCINFTSFNDYFSLDTSSLGGGFIYTTASLGKVINLLLHKKNLILCYLPLLFGVIIFPFIVFKSSRNLNLTELVLILMPICMILSPYIWIHDYVVCLPSVIYFAYQIKKNNFNKKYDTFLKALFLIYLVFCFPTFRYLIFDLTECDITSELVLASFATLLLFAKRNQTVLVTSSP